MKRNRSNLPQNTRVYGMFILAFTTIVITGWLAYPGQKNTSEIQVSGDISRQKGRVLEIDFTEIFTWPEARIITENGDTLVAQQPVHWRQLRASDSVDVYFKADTLVAAINPAGYKTSKTEAMSYIFVLGSIAFIAFIVSAIYLVVKRPHLFPIHPGLLVFSSIGFLTLALGINDLVRYKMVTSRMEKNIVEGTLTAQSYSEYYIRPSQRERSYFSGVKITDMQGSDLYTTTPRYIPSDENVSFYIDSASNQVFLKEDVRESLLFGVFVTCIGLLLFLLPLVLELFLGNSRK